MDPDRSLADEFAAKRSAAEAHLWREMEACGLHRRDGWKIDEFLRDSPGGCELVLRPIHLRLLPPPDLECIVGIVERTGQIEAHCQPELP